MSALVAGGDTCGAQLMRTAKVTLSGIETIRSIKRGHVHNRKLGAQGEIGFISQLFKAA